MMTEQQLRNEIVDIHVTINTLKNHQQKATLSLHLLFVTEIQYLEDKLKVLNHVLEGESK